MPEQLDKVHQFEDWSNTGFLICFVLAGVMGVVLQYSTYLCTQVIVHDQCILSTALLAVVADDDYGDEEEEEDEGHGGDAWL